MKSLVCVRDPRATNSIVRVAPNQDFAVQLSSLSGIVDFEYSSEYFDLVEERGVEEGGKLYIFRQLHPALPQWSKVSSVLIGEIFVVRESGNSSLSVVLTGGVESILTVINPTGTRVRLRPHQFLEVVVTNPGNRVKDYTIVGGNCGIMYIRAADLPCQLLRGETEKTQFWHKENDVFPLLQRSDANEHHFWFKPLLQRDVVMPTGVYDAGKIIFQNGLEVNIDLRLRRKDTKKRQEMRGSQLIVHPNRHIVPHRCKVELEEIEDNDFGAGCDTLMHDNGKRVLTTKDNRVVVYDSAGWAACQKYGWNKWP